MNTLKTLSTAFVLASLTLPGGLRAAHADAAPVIAAPADTGSTDTIVPDRPDFTDGTTVIRQLQVEGGATYGRTGSARGASFGELLVRVPVSQKLELRVGTPSYLHGRDSGVSAAGLDDSNVGVKLNLSEGGEGRLATAILLSSTLPTGARRVAEHRYQPQAKLSAEYEFCSEVSLGVNLGYGRPTDGGQRFSQAFASASLGLTFTDRLGAFVEAYGLTHADATGVSAKYADTGVSYLVNRDLSLDARVGIGINNHAHGPDYFYGVGASQRF